jgi:glutamate-5-semialdehyde dehydrogenase
MDSIRSLALRARACAPTLARAHTDRKNAALLAMCAHIRAQASEILAQNALDVHEQAHAPSGIRDRLTLTPARIEAMCQGIEAVCALPDPIGTTLAHMTRPNGLRITQIRVPIGLIGMIYEARPNVTMDAIALCLKTGNAVLLRGGTAAHHTNTILVHIAQQALATTPIPADAIALVTEKNRSAIDEMLGLTGIVDCVIPRGGSSLIAHCIAHARVPIIETGAGICHTFVDASADADMAEAIVINAKVQRPSVCNAMETLLIHERFAHTARLLDALTTRGVALYTDDHVRARIDVGTPVTEQHYRTEYNDLMLNVRIVRDVDEALEHIHTYGTKHSECIVTKDDAIAAKFLSAVDAAAVYCNASTRFTDGFEFGFGAEIGISTQKLHARGPMGLPALTSTKYVVHGDGHIRGSAQ